ncbi:MAG: CBASS oligonucleotide cyclase [Bacteroidota bacterium]
MKQSNKATMHRRLKCFITYIAPDKGKREAIERQSNEIRECIEKHSKEDGLTLLSKPYSGSFATKTGLKRSLQGNDEVEGQDIDLAFIMKDEDKNGDPLGCLVEDFVSYLKSRWPATDIGKSKSSAYINFSGTKLRFDVVPLIETKRKNIQKLIRTTGNERQSSVQRHADFITKRTGDSNQLKGVVKFNECVRLMKWWRYQRQTESNIFGNDEDDEKIPSFLLNLLCAHAYDEESVHETYADTLKKWFGFLAHVVRNRKRIVFDDFIKSHLINNSGLWQVIDPMDDSNNIVGHWKSDWIDELAEWLENGRDEIIRAIRYDEEGEDTKSLDCLVNLFGNSIKNHCK